MKNKKKSRSFLTLLLCMGLVLVLAGCSSAPANGEAGEKTTAKVQTGNPIVQYETLADAEKAAGFSFTVPEGVNVNGADYEQYYWATINKNLVEVRYGAEGNEVCYLRKAAVGATGNPLSDATSAKEDISGDYNVYDTVKEVSLKREDGREYNVTLKGQEEKFYLATWHLSSNSDNVAVWNYALGIQGVPEEDLLELVQMVE